MEAETAAFRRYVKSLRASAETLSNCTIRDDIMARFVEERSKMKQKIQVYIS